MARFIIYHRQRRTRDYTITLYQSDGVTAFNIASGDRVLVKIGRNSQEPDLEIDSDEATDNGSAVTLTIGSNVVSLRIAEGDAADMAAGVHDCEVVVVDASEDAGEKVKHVQMGTFCNQPTMQGLPDWTESSSSSS